MWDSHNPASGRPELTLYSRMSNTANLVLPYLAVGQAQKHVTLNESLRRLDALVQLSVISATTTAQPGSPADGAVYIVPAGKSGAAWSAYANGSLAYYRDGAWEQLTPREGWLAYVKDTGLLLHYAGAAWALFEPGELLTVSGADKVLGRSSSGAGPAEEIPCTVAGRALLDDVDAAAQRATLGLGSAAVKDAGTSGNSVPLLDGVNVWSGEQTVANASPRLSLHDIDSLAPAAVATLAFRDSSGAIVGQVQYGGDTIYFDNPYASTSGFKWRNGASNSLHMQLTGAGVLTTGGVRPLTDNTYTLGDVSARWSTVYAATGAINTSDAREKTALQPLSEAEKRAILRVIRGAGLYRWLAAIETKGDSARFHAGVTAQAVAEAFVAEGLDPARYALWCANAVVDPATGGTFVRYGVRYDQLFAMALAALFDG